MTWRRLARWAFVILGTGLAAAAVFAPQLGLDTNQDWGPSRLLLLAAGIFVAALGWVEAILRGLAAGMRRGRAAAGGILAGSGLADFYLRQRAAWASSSFSRRLARVRESAQAFGQRLLERYPFLRPWFGSHQRRVVFTSWAAFALVAVSYVWFVSVGTWVRWPGTSAYHDLQAEAFLHGQTYLVEEPPADLLALPDPYDPSARSGLAYLWDASLYQGHYFLYWGPVPALLLMPIKALADVTVGDDVLVLVFSIGTLFWATRILTRLWRESFPDVSGWAVVGSVLVVGWANPATWLLNSPWVYESAIAGGQFFLVMGLASLVPFFQRGAARPLSLVWAGISLALAVGTRFSLVAPVAVVTSIALVRLLVPGPLAGRRISGVLALLLPLAAGAALLAGYNFARFGSPTELGHSYQLTSLNLEEGGLSTTSLGNIPPNLYNYLLNPMRRISVFPYVKPRWGGTYMSMLRLPVPEAYYSRQVTGLLWAAPFALLCFTGIVGWWKRFGPGQGRLGRARAAVASSSGAAWVRAAVLGSGLAGFAFVQLYLVASMRYQADFMTSIMLGAAIGFWGGLNDRRRGGRPQTAFALIGFLLMIWTAVAGLLLGVTSYHARFEKLNPDLFRWLTDVFTL